MNYPRPRNLCDGKNTKLTSSYTPILPKEFGGEYGTLLLWALVLHNVAITPGITKSTAFNLLHYIRNSGLHLHQSKDVADPTTPAAGRYGNNLYSDSPTHRGQSIGDDTPQNRRFHLSLIKAFKEYGLRVLKVPQGNIDLMRLDIRAYQDLARLGKHNDYTGKVDDCFDVLRVCAGIGSNKRVFLHLMQRDEDSEKDRVMFRDNDDNTVPSLELGGDDSPFFVYGMTPAGAGRRSLGVIGSKHVIVHHEVENNVGANATVIADFHFNNPREAAKAMKYMREQPFHLNLDLVNVSEMESNIMSSAVSCLSFYFKYNVCIIWPTNTPSLFITTIL